MKKYSDIINYVVIWIYHL